MNIWYFVTLPFAIVINMIYNIIPNYGVAIIIFTILVKAALLPLSIKQQKSTLEMSKIQPHLKKLQEKHKNDKEKLNTETMNLYKEHNINPMAGCLPTLIQLPLIIAVYNVISNPLTYMFSLTEDKIQAILQILKDDALIDQSVTALSHLDMLNYIYTHSVDLVSRGIEGINQVIDFNFLGLNLAQTPQAVISDWSTNFIWILPVISLATAYWSSRSAMQMQPSNADPNAAQTQKTMMLMMPLMSGYFSFILPAGVGLYWIVSNLTQVAQQYFMNHKFAALKSSDVIDVTPTKKNNK